MLTSDLLSSLGLRAQPILFALFHVYLAQPPLEVGKYEMSPHSNFRHGTDALLPIRLGIAPAEPNARIQVRETEYLTLRKTKSTTNRTVASLQESQPDTEVQLPEKFIKKKFKIKNNITVEN